MTEHSANLSDEFSGELDGDLFARESNTQTRDASSPPLTEARISEAAPKPQVPYATEAARADAGKALPVSDASAPTKADIARRSPFIARWRYFWSLLVAAMLLLVIGPPTLAYCYLTNQREKLYPFALFGGRTWLRLSGMTIVVRGGERLNPHGTYIYAANHRSYLDTATLFCHLPQRIGLFAKKELLKVPILGYGMSYVNIMAIDRTSFESAAKTVKAATDKIKSGRSFGVFVEGRRAAPGELLPFKKGAFYMAIETGTPIVPVAIKHTDYLMGKGDGTCYPGTIEMVLLEPVETTNMSGDEDVRRLLDLTRARIAEELKPLKM